MLVGSHKESRYFGYYMLSSEKGALFITVCGLISDTYLLQ